MGSISFQLDLKPDELIHDAQVNFQENRLATCGSDGKIKIFELQADHSRLIDELSGHEAAIWQLDWSHDNLLASCSYDRKVIIWQENTSGRWEKCKEYKGHDSSVTSVQWAPREYGRMLACASSDCSISILRQRDDGEWETERIAPAHGLGVMTLSWAPPISSVSTIYSQTRANNNVPERAKPVERLVSGGCDNLVKIWQYKDELGKFVEERALEGHTDWVQDVTWAPSIGLPKWYIASCSRNKEVIIWMNSEGPSGQEWESKILKFDHSIWHVSWSVMGNILAISFGNDKVGLFKEDLNGNFKCIQESVQSEQNTAIRLQQ